MFAWLLRRSECGGCGIRTRSPVFARNPRCAACSVIRRRASSPLDDAQKNALRRLRSSVHGLVRPADASGSRSVLWRHAHLPRVRGAARAVPKLRQGEERAARLPGQQSVLHQALCPLRGPALSSDHDQGRCRGAPSALGDGQDAGDAVHASAVGQGGHTRSQGDRHRRDLDPQGPRLPNRGERPASTAPDLVWRRGPQRGEHGAVLRLAGREEDQGHSPGGDGYVEAVSQRDGGARPAGGDPVRQVPHHASLGQGPRRGAQVRVPPTQRPGSKLHQRPEVHAAFVAPGEPDPGGRQNAQEAAWRPTSG